MNPYPTAVRRAVRTLLLALLLTACSGESADAVPGPIFVPPSGTPSGTPSTQRPGSAATVTLPPANAPFDYQIGGAYPPVAGVGIVDRDWHDAPAATGYGICYLNAFQTQTEDFAWWQKNHPDLLLRDAAGKLVVDSVWNEVLLDLRTAAKRSALATIVGGWLQQCAAKGYRGAELDNLDTYTRSRGLLTYPQNRAYAALLVTRAHTAGLAVAQKNTVDRSADLKAVAGFDFAIVEECQVFDECGAATAVYGRQVYEIEYTDAGGLPNFRTACAARGTAISVILRDRDVVPRGAPGYAYRSC